MRPESEDQCSVTQSTSDDNTQDFLKVSKISYTSDFILSFAELDACKKLPKGLDKSIIRELNHYSTGLWQSCHDSDSGRSCGNLSRHSRQNPEHGLSGISVFPKAHGSVSGSSAPMVWGDGQYLLNKSPEPYRPPHLSKAKPHSGTANLDFHNHETFGPCEHLSHERAEEERRRRDSFELMRKEQQTACDEHKENLDPGIPILPGNSGNSKMILSKCNKSEEFVASPAPKSDSVGHNFTTQTSASRQLLPPDFRCRSLEDNLGTNFLAQSLVSEPCDVKAVQIKSPMLHSSDVVGQFVEGEKKPVCSISCSDKKGGSQVCRVSNEQGTVQTSAILSSGRNELAQKPKKSIYAAGTDEISEQLYSFNKPNVTPGVLTCGDFKESKLPKLDENHSTKPLLVKGWRISGTEDRQPNSPNDLDESQRLFSLLRMAGITDLEPSSKLNMGFSDKLHGVGNDCSLLKISNKGNPKDFEEDWTCKPNLSYVGGSGEKANFVDEICLPDEDSLITVEGTIFPQDSMFLAAGNHSTSPVNIAERLGAFGIGLGDKRSDLPSSEDPTSFHSSHNVMGLDTTYQNFHLQQPYPQIHDLGSPVFHPLDSQRAQMSSKVKFDSETYLYNPNLLQHSPTNVLISPFQHSHAAPTRFNDPVNHPPIQHMLVPGDFSSHELYGMSGGAFTDYPINRMHNFSPNYQQQYYAGLKLPIPDLSVGQISNQAALAQLLEMEMRANQMHPLTVAGRGKRMFGRQKHKGFSYGR